MAGQPSSFIQLKKKWEKNHRDLQAKLWKEHGYSLNQIQNTTKQVMAGSLASLLMFAHPAPATILAANLQNPEPVVEIVHTAGQLIADLGKHLPQTVEPLTQEQEQEIGVLLSDYFKMPVSAVLQGNRLNRSYGYIGAEQHLMRYPGDSVENMAPGRGAWGYFTDSASTMTQKDIEREKYYIAVQTFLSPGWAERTNELYKFFKYRKMLVVNAENGKAMVVVIADAGPAEWTGKHLGGSPEVMQYLERVDGSRKGPVLYFFIDDPEDKIPLGPVTIQ